MNLYMSHSLVVFLSAIAFVTCKSPAPTSTPLGALPPTVATRSWFNPMSWFKGENIPPVTPGSTSISSNTTPGTTPGTTSGTTSGTTTPVSKKINDLSNLGNAFSNSVDDNINPLPGTPTPPGTPSTPGTPADDKKKAKSIVTTSSDGTDPVGGITQPVVVETSISGTTTSGNNKTNSVVNLDGTNTNVTGDGTNVTGDGTNATEDGTSIPDDNDTLKGENPDNTAEKPKSKRSKSYSSHEHSSSSDDSADKNDSSWSGGKIALVVIGSTLSVGALGGIGYILYRRSKNNE